MLRNCDMDVIRGSKADILPSAKVTICEMCCEEISKYKCPRCSKQTCSVKCVKAHKATDVCNGQRDKLAYVPISKFTENHLLSDYRFLEDVNRTADNASRNSRKIFNTNHNNKKFLKRAAERKGVQLQLLPNVFTKHKLNSSRTFKESPNTIFWCVNWKFPQSTDYAEILERKISDKLLFSNVLKKYLHSTESDPVHRQRFKEYISDDLGNIEIYMEYDKSIQQNKKYYKLNLQRSIEENLKGKLIIEYPTVHVVLKRDAVKYETRLLSGSPMEKNKDGDQIIISETNEVTHIEHDNMEEKKKVEIVNCELMEYEEDGNFNYESTKNQTDLICGLVENQEEHILEKNVEEYEEDRNVAREIENVAEYEEDRNVAQGIENAAECEEDRNVAQGIENAAECEEDRNVAQEIENAAECEEDRNVEREIENAAECGEDRNVAREIENVAECEEDRNVAHGIEDVLECQEDRNVAHGIEDVLDCQEDRNVEHGIENVAKCKEDVAHGIRNVAKFQEYRNVAHGIGNVAECQEDRNVAHGIEVVEKKNLLKEEMANKWKEIGERMEEIENKLKEVVKKVGDVQNKMEEKPEVVNYKPDEV